MNHTIRALVALAILLMASCRDDNDAPVSKGEENIIRFTATSPITSRAAPTTTATIKEFTVYAFTDGKPYMTNVAVTRKGAEWSYNPVMYWPETPVNFFAFSPMISNAPDDSDGGLGTIPNYLNSGTTDLLYAVNMNETSHAEPVQVNFRHALSNVIIKLSSVNSNITVKVAHVGLYNIAQRGTFKFPFATTAADKTDVVGSWSNLGSYGNMLTYYSISPEDDVTLDATPKDLSVGTLETSFVIPQPLTEVQFTNSGYIGSYISVDCEIFDAVSNVKIWPTPNTPSQLLVPQTDYGRLVFPMSSGAVKEYNPGYSYIYNIVINNPAELKPINFGVTIDEYKDQFIDS